MAEKKVNQEKPTVEGLQEQIKELVEMNKGLKNQLENLQTMKEKVAGEVDEVHIVEYPDYSKVEICDYKVLREKGYNYTDQRFNESKHVPKGGTIRAKQIERGDFKLGFIKRALEQGNIKKV